MYATCSTNTYICLEYEPTPIHLHRDNRCPQVFRYLDIMVKTTFIYVSRMTCLLHCQVKCQFVVYDIDSLTMWCSKPP